MAIDFTMSISISMKALSASGYPPRRQQTLFRPGVASHRNRCLGQEGEAERGMISNFHLANSSVLFSPSWVESHRLLPEALSLMSVLG